MDAHSSQEESPATNQPLIKEGKWTTAEHDIFLVGLKQHGCDWNAIAEQLRTRTPSQVRSHAQKYFNKQANDQDKIGFNKQFIIGGEREPTITRSKLERPKIEATPIKNRQEKQKEEEKEKQKEKDKGKEDEKDEEKATLPLPSKKSIKKDKKKSKIPQKSAQEQPEQDKKVEMMPEEQKISVPASNPLKIPVLINATEIQIGKYFGLAKPEALLSRVSMAWTDCSMIQEMLKRLQQPGLDLSGMHAINRAGLVGCFRKSEVK